MKNKLFAVSLSLGLITSSIAATSFIPQSILKNNDSPSKKWVKNTAPAKDQYVYFSGHWLGVCDNYPDEKIEMDIEIAPDFSSMKFDNTTYPIDAISTQSAHGKDQQESHINHIRWSPDGQGLLVTISSYFKEGNLSQDGLESILGNAQMFMNNEQLISNYELTFFRDGVLGNTLKIHCVYDKQNKK